MYTFAVPYSTLCKLMLWRLQVFQMQQMWPCQCVSLPLCTDYFWSSSCLIRCVTWNVLPLSTMASEAFRVCCKRDWLETNLDCNKALQFIETHQSHRSDQSGKWVGERDTQGTSPGFLSVMTAELGVGLKVEMCKGTEGMSEWVIGRARESTRLPLGMTE